MATAHDATEPRATPSTVVLPVTSRGIALTDRACWVILGIAMAASAALILYLNRGTTFPVDDLRVVTLTPELSTPGDVLEPHGGHLVATARVTFKLVLGTLGPQYTVFRLLSVAALLISASLLYALLKRRIGALPALPPAAVVLLLGSAWPHVVLANGFTMGVCVAAGLGALLALEREDRRGAVLACVLLCLSVATYSVGLAFLAGAATAVLLGPGRWRRAWVFAIPLVLYAGWWYWADPSQTNALGEQPQDTNFLLIPSFVGEALAAVLAAVAGLGYDFGGPAPPEIDPAWGYVLAPAAVAALVLRIRRGGVPSALWVALAIALTYWSIGALVTGVGTREPSADRYVYVGSIAVLLVAAAAASGIRFSRAGLVALFGVAALSLATNVASMRDAAAWFRNDYSPRARAQFTALEIARPRVDPEFLPVFFVPGAVDTGSARDYLKVVDRYGSLAFTRSELSAQPQAVREQADRVLAVALGLRLERSNARAPSRGCRTLEAGRPGATVSVALPAGGARLRTPTRGRAAVTVGRFGPPAAEVGTLEPGEPRVLRLPPDSVSMPWHASVAAGAVEVCPLQSASARTHDRGKNGQRPT